MSRLWLGHGVGVGSGFGAPSGGTVVLPTPAEILGANLVYQQLGITGAVLEAGGVLRVQTYTDGSAAANDQTTLASAQRPQSEDTGWDGAGSLWHDGNDSLVGASGNLATELGNGEDKAFTIVIAAQVNAVGAAQYLWSIGSSSSDTAYLAALMNSTGVTLVKRSGATTKNCIAAGAQTTDRAIWTFGVDATGQVAEIRKNNVVQTLDTTDLNVASIAVDRWAIGVLRRTSTAAFLTGRVAAVVCANRATTSQEKTDLYNWVDAQINGNATRPMLLIDGNSFTQQRPTDVKNSWVPYLGLNCDIANNAHQGDVQTGSAGINGRVAQLTSNYSAARSAYAAICFAGVSNDIAAGTSSATCLTLTETWAAAIKAAHPGAYVIVTTIPKRNDVAGAAETVRTTYNAALLATPGSADWVYDADAAVPEATSDAAVYSDGVHFTAGVAQTRFAAAMAARLVSHAGFGP